MVAVIVARHGSPLLQCSHAQRAKQSEPEFVGAAPADRSCSATQSGSGDQSNGLLANRHRGCWNSGRPIPSSSRLSMITSRHDNTKWWRPRFSVRSLVIVITLVCCYAACWGPTKSRGIEEVRQFVFLVSTVSADANDHTEEIERFEARFEPHGRVLRSRFIMDPPDPDVVERLHESFNASATVPLVLGITSQRTRCYYFWFFGYVAKLPYEREISVSPL